VTRPRWIQRILVNVGVLALLADDQHEVLQSCRDAIIDACYELHGLRCEPHERTMERCEECPVGRIDELKRVYEDKSASEG